MVPRNPSASSDKDQVGDGVRSVKGDVPSGLTTDDETVRRVLESAAALQAMVPDAVLVGGTAAAFYAGHRQSYDHDHVVTNLADRFDMVLEALESQAGWITNRVVARKLILGELGGIETGVRQLRRTSPLEVIDYEIDGGRRLRVPTPDETLRVKGYLVIVRNRTRDYLDVAALAAWMGIDRAAATLSDIDYYYDDQRDGGDGVATQLVVQLGDPRPADTSTTTNLANYRRLAKRWQDWDEVRAVCSTISVTMCTTPAPEERR